MKLKKALRLLKKGKKITYDGWGKEFYLETRIAQLSHGSTKIHQIFKEEELAEPYMEDTWSLWEKPIDDKTISNEIAKLEQAKSDIERQIKEWKGKY